MPKTSDYSKSFIYKFVCNDITITEIYVGASCHWVKRKAQHKSSCNNEKNKKSYNLYVYQFMRENGGWDNWTMLKICDYPCETRFDRDIEERRHIELLCSTLNKAIPTRTDKEYKDANKIIIAGKNKVYKENNKIIIAEKNKVYKERNKEKINRQRAVLLKALEEPNIDV